MRLGHVIPVGLVVMLTVAPSVAAAGGEDPGEMTYTVSPDELKFDFTTDRVFDLKLPGLGEVKVEGTWENPPDDPVWVRGAPGDDGRVMPSRAGEAVPSPHPMVEGHVVGYPHSDADLVLGKYGVYGSIELDGTIFELNPRKGADGLYIQQVDTRAGPPPTPPRPASVSGSNISELPTTKSHGASSSEVYMDMEPSYYENVGDPESRVQSAFNEYQDLYSDSATNVPLELRAVWKTGVEITPGSEGDNVDGETAVIDYRDWLAGGMTVDGVHAYQLWTGVDLVEEECENCLYGIAYNPDTVDNHHSDWSRSSSLLEGTDHYFDEYDPDEVHDRGIVSGHELGHLYGQEDHPSNTGTIMDPGPPGERSFQFVDDTVNEIYHRFHADYEWDDHHTHYGRTG